MNPSRYEILENLGQGQNGQTYLTRIVDLSNSKTCVIKQVYKPSEPRDSLTKRLRSVSQHPQLPTFLDSWQTPDGQFFAFEYIKALPINQVESPPWSAIQVKSWLLATLPVLEHLHSFRLVHGDVRPANIRQVQPLPILVDFRITQRLDKQSSALAVLSGDAAYAAPEQALGTLVYASDLYSLGLVAIHLLTGLSPFELYAVAENRWIWPDLIAQPLPKNLGQVITKLLERSLEKRYASAAQVITDLKRSTPKSWLNKARSLLPVEAAWPSSLKGETPAKSLPPSQKLISWRPLYQLQTGLTTALALHHTTLALGTDTGKVLVCDLATATDIHTLEGRGHRDRITALAFHPQKQILYSASNDGTVKLWDLQQGKLIQTLKQSGWQPTDMAVAPPYLIVSDGTGLITLWDLDQLSVCHRFNQHQDWVHRIAAKEDRLVSISRDRTLRIWSLSENRLLQTLSINPSKGLVVHPSGNYAIVGSDRGQVDVWPVGQPVGQPTKPTQLCFGLDSITALALSPDARLLAVGTDGNVLRVYEGASGQCVSELAQGWGVMAIAFDGQHLISSSQDETVTIWQRVV